jgi:protein gp37
MALNSPIEWTEATWNPVTGCTKISSGCANCYAERMSVRLKAMGQQRYSEGFKVQTHEDTLTLPLSWKKPRRIFVNSMGDLFHEHVPFDFIRLVYRTMEQAPWHCFQVLTKRAERLARVGEKLNWKPNVWMGVTVESGEYVHRIDLLRQIPASIRFVSFEPLIGPVSKINLKGIDWVIVGGESGPHARQMKEDWVIEIKAQCEAQGIAFFFKQWGGWNKKKNGNLLQGEKWQKIPLNGSNRT